MKTGLYKVIILGKFAGRNVHSEIPNLVGMTSDAIGAEQSPALTGPFYRATRTAITGASYSRAATTGASTSFDASRVSSCYGNYSQVNPLYEAGRYHIKYV